MTKELTWYFPLPRTHTGMLLGNAVAGAMVWGGDNVLKVTLNRADFWDHRGGKPWTADMNYGGIRELLDARNETGLRAVFNQTVPKGCPVRPTVLPLGRMELEFDEGITLTEGHLFPETGHVEIAARDAAGRLHRLRMEMDAREPVLLLELPAGCGVRAIRRVPAWEYVGEHLKAVSFEPPALFDGEALSGWVQTRPADEPLCLGYRSGKRRLWVALVYGRDEPTARANANRQIDRAERRGVAGLRAANRKWWSAYWAATPRVSVPNKRLEFIYRYGMYKFAGLTAPHGVAATLQGPWVEEYQLPPWSCDYHFNINVQMCYWPAYPGNHLEHLRPILDLVWSWRDTLRENARLFIGVEDGYLLPHAVDDRGTCMGGFWTGTIDHGCTAWVAKMMYDYWLYGGDAEYLRQVAYPFMAGAMRVYEAMLERDGDRFVLPVSVSPEYRGASFNAWGRNASFQLAAVHWLIEALQRAGEALGVAPRPIWGEIQRGLPKACVEAPHKVQKIVLWEGTDLEESHRHHSHLAGFHPFDVLDTEDPAWHAIATATCRWWQRQGMGQWTGWCMPWASMLQTRIGIPEMTELILEHWIAICTNEGHGTLHDPITWTRLQLPEEAARRKQAIAPGFGSGGEIMQIEAGMAAAAAVMDMLVHVRRGLHHVFPGVPGRWREAEFDGIRTEGGFLVGATMRAGRVTEVRVKATREGVFRVRNPWGNAEAAVQTGRRRLALCGDLLSVRMKTGATCRLRAG